MRRHRLRIIFAGAITACFTSRRRRIPTCAGLRIPNGILKHWQFAGMADLAERLCGPFCHVTTRANLQVREIPPKHAVALIEGIQDLGLCSRGSGADNIRNVTGTPTAGIDPQELLDTREYAREWHYHILNDRSLTGLPRKFNVAFDGAGKIAVLEDTNDIAFRRGRGEGRLRRRARRLVSPRDRRHHRPQGFCQGDRHHRQAGGRDQSRRRHRPRIHRSRRPHQPPQGAAEIRDRRHGHGEISGPGRGEARPRLHPRAAGSARAAAGVRPHGAYRRAQAEAGRA